MEIIYVSTSCFATCGNKLFIKPRGRWGKEKKKKKRNDTSQFVFSNETRDAPVETIIHLRQRDPVLSKSCG